MAKDPAFLFYPGDYLQDTQGMNEGCQVAYDRIMCKHMLNIPITKEQLNHFTKRLNPEDKNEVESVLTKVEGGYIIQWVADSINKRKAFSESRRENRRGKKQKEVLTYDKHMENEIVIENKNEIIVNDNINAKFEKMLLESESVLGTVCFQLKIGTTDAIKLRTMFVEQMAATAEHHNNYTDYSKHFVNWAKLNKDLLKGEQKGKLASHLDSHQEALLILQKERNGE